MLSSYHHRYPKSELAFTLLLKIIPVLPPDALGWRFKQPAVTDGVSFFDMARLGVGLNRNDGRVNRVQAGPGGTLVIPALDPKMIYPIPQAETDAK